MGREDDGHCVCGLGDSSPRVKLRWTPLACHTQCACPASSNYETYGVVEPQRVKLHLRVGPTGPTFPQLPSSDPFSYSDGPLEPFLRPRGIDRGSQFHTTVVLSPQPAPGVNPGISAWSAVGAQTLFVMRCSPQLYYEVGARVWGLLAC